MNESMNQSIDDLYSCDCCCDRYIFSIWNSKIFILWRGNSWFCLM